MKTYCKDCLRMIGLVLLASLLGCSGQGAPTYITQPPVTVTVNPLSSDTPLPNTPALSPSPEMPAYVPSPTRTFGPPTATPAPTLCPDEEQALVLDLLQDNAGCRLPCWWGFTPGETTWQTAQAFFASLGKSPAADHDPRGTVNYTVSLRVPEWIDQEGHIQQDYVVRDGIIEVIITDPGDSQSYTLPQVLAAYGQPTAIWIRTFSAVADRDDGVVPFFVLLHYQQEGFLIRYVGFTHKEDGQIPICPQQAGGVLWLWSPKREMTLTDIANIGVGGFPTDEVSDYRSLEEATGMSVEEFYQTFMQPDNQTCLETPVDMW